MSKVLQTRLAQALNFGIQPNISGGEKFPRSTNMSGVFGSTTAGPPASASLAYNSPSANDLQGALIVANTNATWASGSPVYGTVLSNTAATPTVVTMDGWWKVIDDTAATPASNAPYVVLPVQAPFWVMGLASASATASTDSGALPVGASANEVTGNGMGRSIVTTFTVAASPYATGTLGITFTYTGSSSLTIFTSFITNSQTAANTAGRGNFMFFEDQLNGSTGYVVASNGDTLQITYTITFATVP